MQPIRVSHPHTTQDHHHVEPYALLHCMVAGQTYDHHTAYNSSLSNMVAADVAKQIQTHRCIMCFSQAQHSTSLSWHTAIYYMIVQQLH